MKQNITKILRLVEEKYEFDQKHTWSKGSQTFYEEIKKELEEVKDELNANKKCYLEDELGDVFWDYLNLLYNLEKENKIELQNVFKRCHKKFSERIEGVKNGVLWVDVKKVQKEELQKEQEELDKNLIKSS